MLSAVVISAHLGSHLYAINSDHAIALALSIYAWSSPGAPGPAPQGRCAPARAYTWARHLCWYPTGSPLFYAARAA